MSKLFKTKLSSVLFTKIKKLSSILIQSLPYPIVFNQEKSTIPFYLYIYIYIYIENYRYNIKLTQQSQLEGETSYV